MTVKDQSTERHGTTRSLSDGVDDRASLTDGVDDHVSMTSGVDDQWRR